MDIKQLFMVNNVLQLTSSVNLFTRSLLDGFQICFLHNTPFQYRSLIEKSSFPI